jgi:hypothetical protein
MTRPDPTRTTAETPPQPEAAAPGSLLGTAVAVGAGVLGAGIVSAALAPVLGALVEEAGATAAGTAADTAEASDDWDLGLGDLFDL